MLEQLHSAFGLALLTAVAWLISENRRLVSWRVAAAGIGLQILIALLLLKVQVITQFFSVLNGAVVALQNASEAGTSFVFSYLAGGPLPFEEVQPGASFILGLRALPLVIVVSALTAVLSYWRILPWLVKGFSWLLERVLGVGGAVGLGTAANIFVGMVEAPLFIRPYLLALTRSELFIIMSAGMATIAGTVLVLYASILGDVMPDAVGHLLAASIISAPAVITIAKLMVPEDSTPTPVGQDSPSDAASTMDAVTKGTQSGLLLFLNITAMLIVLVALVHLLNAMLGMLPDIAGSPISLERTLGVMMAPVVWLMGVPWSEAFTAGALMGTKTVLNEFLAFLQLTDLPPGALSPRSQLIMTYALCGFANLGSLGILIGGLSTMAPERQKEIVALGPKSIVAGTLATCCTGAVVGML